MTTLTPDQLRLASALHRAVELLIGACLDAHRPTPDRLLDVTAGYALFATAVYNDLDLLVASGVLTDDAAREARRVYRSALDRAERTVRDAISNCPGASCPEALRLVLSEAVSLVVAPASVPNAALYWGS